MSAADRLYARLPLPLQNAAVTAFGYSWRHTRFGGRFAEYRDAFAARDHWSEERWQEHQAEELRTLIAVAAQAPWYRARWGGADAPTHLPDLPIVTKDDVRREPTAFCIGGAPPRGAIVTGTSGSSGTPLTVYDSRDDMRRVFAVRAARYRAYAGVDYTMPRATFGGRRIEPASDSSGPYHRFNRAERQVYLSPYHLGPATVGRYVEALWRHRPVWLTGYAGSISELGRLADEQGLRLPPFRALITAAEPVPDWLRRHALEVFGCPVTEEYGMAEQVCLALECPEGSLHVMPDAGIVEILDEDGRACPPGEVGEIVGTGFLRRTQPLLRYRTGDLGALAAEPCACGRPTPIISALEGRVDDVVVGADGRRVGRLSPVPKGLPGILAVQFVQERPGAVTAHVVAEGVLEARVRDELRSRLIERLGRDTLVEVVQTTSLLRTPRGKIRGVVRLDGEGGDLG